MFHIQPSPSPSSSSVHSIQRKRSQGYIAKIQSKFDPKFSAKHDQDDKEATSGHGADVDLKGTKEGSETEKEPSEHIVESPHQDDSELKSMNEEQKGTDHDLSDESQDYKEEIISGNQAGANGMDSIAPVENTGEEASEQTNNEKHLETEGENLEEKKDIDSETIEQQIPLTTGETTLDGYNSPFDIEEERDQKPKPMEKEVLEEVQDGTEIQIEAPIETEKELKKEGATQQNTEHFATETEEGDVEEETSKEEPYKHHQTEKKDVEEIGLNNEDITQPCKEEQMKDDKTLNGHVGEDIIPDKERQGKSLEDTKVTEQTLEDMKPQIEPSGPFSSERGEDTLDDEIGHSAANIGSEEKTAEHVNIDQTDKKCQSSEESGEIILASEVNEDASNTKSSINGNNTVETDALIPKKGKKKKNSLGRGDDKGLKSGKKSLERQRKSEKRRSKGTEKIKQAKAPEPLKEEGIPGAEKGEGVERLKQSEETRKIKDSEEKRNEKSRSKERSLVHQTGNYEHPTMKDVDVSAKPGLNVKGISKPPEVEPKSSKLESIPERKNADVIPRASSLEDKRVSSTVKFFKNRQWNTLGITANCFFKLGVVDS